MIQRFTRRVLSKRTLNLKKKAVISVQSVIRQKQCRDVYLVYKEHHRKLQKFIKSIENQEIIHQIQKAHNYSIEKLASAGKLFVILDDNLRNSELLFIYGIAIYNKECIKARIFLKNKHRKKQRFIAKDLRFIQSLAKLKKSLSPVKITTTQQRS